MGQKASCLADGPPFFQAVKDGRVEVIAELLCKNPALARHEMQEPGVTVWHYAAEQGDIKLLKTLVEVMETIIVRHHEFKIDRSGVHQYIGILLNQRNGEGQTAIMLACEAGSTKCCQYLLTKGATPWVADRQAGRTCLHYAARSGSADCIDVVATHLQARGGDQDAIKLVNRTNLGGFLPLHYAVWHEQLDALRSLANWGSYLPARAQGSLPDGFSCNPGSTALHLAAMRGNTDITAALLHYQVMRQQQLERQFQQQQQQQHAHGATHPPPSADTWDSRRVPDNMCQLPFSIALTRHHYHLLHLLHPLNPLNPPSNAPPQGPSQPEATPASNQADPSLDKLKEHLLAEVNDQETKLQQSLQPPHSLSDASADASLNADPNQPASALNTHSDAQQAFYDVLAIEARLLRVGTGSEMSDDSYMSSPVGYPTPSSTGRMWEMATVMTPQDSATTSVAMTRTGSAGEAGEGGVGSGDTDTRAPGELGLEKDVLWRRGSGGGVGFSGRCGVEEDNDEGAVEGVLRRLVSEVVLAGGT